MGRFAGVLCLFALAACGTTTVPNSDTPADAGADAAADIAGADSSDAVSAVDAVDAGELTDALVADGDADDAADAELTDAVDDAETAVDAPSLDAEADGETDGVLLDLPLLPDVPGEFDVPGELDVPAEIDAPTEIDVPVLVDVPVTLDVPALLDVPVEADVPVEVDVPVTPDVPVAPDVVDVADVQVPDVQLPDVPGPDVQEPDVSPPDTAADLAVPDVPEAPDVPDVVDAPEPPDVVEPLDVPVVDDATIDSSTDDALAPDVPAADADDADVPPACLPTGQELCDGVDNDCNGLTDEAGCDDGNACTADTCTVAGCSYAVVAGPCNDGNLCTTSDLCSGGTCVAGPSTLCTKATACTVPACDSGTGNCIEVPAVGKIPCTDADPCTTSEYCVAGKCAGLVVTNCNDGNVCTDDLCESTGGCNYVFNALTCTDGNNCTKPDQCKNGGCIGGATYSCDDNNLCTTDACNAQGGCDHQPVPDTTFCDADGSLCTVGDHCKAGVCTAGAQTTCNDGNPCTFDACNKFSGSCNASVTGQTCSGTVPCATAGETCSNGACYASCDATHPCSNGGTCGAQGLCVLTCDDGNPCTSSDTCTAGVCAGSASTCDDGLVCTADSCDKATGTCVNANTLGASCDDGSACTTGDACNASAVCVPGSTNACEDNNPCTTDACVNKACTHTNLTGACTDNSVCTTGEACVGGFCKGPNVVQVSTFAGSTQGFKDGKGTAAQFNSPRGIVRDSNGTIWVADTGNNAIRQIASNGTVSTVTCTFADTPANFSSPQALALASDGTLYIADTGNHRIRQRASNGTVTTFAGTGTAGFADGLAAVAQFSSPYGIAVGPGGWLAVADRGNNRIRRVSPDGYVTTLAGQASAGFAAGTGAAASFNAPSAIVAAAGGGFYVADATSARIRAVSAAGVVSNLAGSTAGLVDGAAASAKFSNPLGLFVIESESALVVVDTNNDKLRVIAAGTVSTALGTTSGMLDGGSDVAKMAGPQGALSLTDGNVLIADTGNHRIRLVTANSATCDDRNPCTTDVCDPVKGCTFSVVGDGTGCSDADACTTPDACVGGACKGLLKGCDDANVCTDDVCDPNSGACVHNNSTNACDDGNKCTLADRCVAGTCSAEPGSVATLAGQQLTGSADGLGGAASFNGPRQMWADGSGGVYVADTGSNKIRQVSASGGVSTVAGSGASGASDGAVSVATFKAPQGVTVDSSSALWVADTGNNRLRKISSSQVTSPVGTGTAGWKDGAGGIAQFNAPQAIAADSNGNLFVADTANHRIRKVKPDGSVSTLAGTGTAGWKDGANTIAQFSSPAGVAVDSFHNVYVADMNNYRIRKVTPDGTVSTVAGTGAIGESDGAALSATFYLPGQIAFDVAGNLWIADHGKHRIRKLSASGTVSTPFSASVGGFKDGLATAALFSSPWGIWPLADGTILVGDTSNNRIRKRAATAVLCSDGNDCTTDTCDSATGLCATSNVAAGTSCQGGDPCAISKTCTAGNCGGGSAKTCSDASVCTVDSCDSASGACAWTTSDSCQPVRRVFVTSSSFTGALNGLAGADMQCQSAANTKTLGGSWKAWLSDATGNPASRFDQAGVPYVLLNRTPIASDWADLTDGAIGAPINIDEGGKTPAVAATSTSCFTTPIRVFTNTNKNGTAFSTLAADSCNSWTYSGSNTATYHQLDGYGDNSNNQWTEGCANDYCDRVSHLYCFEQTDAYVLKTSGFHSNGKYFVSNATFAGDFNAAGGFCTALLGQTAYVASTSAFLPDTEPYTVWNGNTAASSTTLNCSLYSSNASNQSGVGVQGGSKACNALRAVVCSTDPNDCAGGSTSCGLWD